jgi:hypothetical protein
VYLLCDDSNFGDSILQVITPTTSTLGSSNTDLLPGIYAILLSDVWLSPLLRLSDWMSNLKKHVLAPRARTQEEMNLSFQGTFYNMGERYTVRVYEVPSVFWQLWSNVAFSSGFHESALCSIFLFCTVSRWLLLWIFDSEFSVLGGQVLSSEDLGLGTVVWF